jgi:hypothetical protein
MNLTGDGLAAVHDDTRRTPPTIAVRRCFRGPGTAPQQVSLRFDCEPLLV